MGRVSVPGLIRSILHGGGATFAGSALLLLPVMPAACAEILRRMGETRPVGELRLDRDAVWTTSGERIVATGDPLWPRLEGARRP